MLGSRMDSHSYYGGSIQSLEEWSGCTRDAGETDTCLLQRERIVPTYSNELII